MNNTTKSNPINSSDQTIKKPISLNKPTITITNQQPKNPHDEYDYDHNQYKLATSDHGTTTDANGTSYFSSRFKIEKQYSTGRALQTAVKRVGSIRRSSSVSERYCRIYDQCTNVSDFDDDVDVEEQDQDLQMKKKRSGILKALRFDGWLMGWEWGWDGVKMGKGVGWCGYGEGVLGQRDEELVESGHLLYIWLIFWM
ncbi:hypothetical protein QVD17_26817 [Tagetes erecta]|uniref:Uncharacterized protein n=1 Tax=Tagetes erecta TaxID=13708 RepID=A0AAD8K9Q8_TARER|nr:hypothetical protein QVD17_26817 [Tagetes erecta]